MYDMRNVSVMVYYVLTASYITLLYWNICLAFCYITYVLTYCRSAAIFLMRKEGRPLLLLQKK